MQEFTLEKVIRAWESRFDNDPQSKHSLLDESYSLTSLSLSLLAEGSPVSSNKLAEQSGLRMEEVESHFKRFKECGGEFNARGELIGAALTLEPTPHKFHINGRFLYTWCSLDALFLPGLLGMEAEVESTCPTTGEDIKLLITPKGVAEYTPYGTVLSITIPGISCQAGCCCGPDKTGPKSDACSQMNFFSSLPAAEEWLKDRPGIAILTVEEAWQLAKVNWIDR